MKSLPARRCSATSFVYVTLFIAVFAGYQAAVSSGAENPNIVIILVDDMGYGDAGCYNPESKIPTPNIDGLARDGMRFTDAHAPGPLCHVSRYGLMTGRYPFRTKFNWNRNPVIAEGETTIASLLKRSGYRTAMVGKWHLGFKESDRETYEGVLEGGPFDRGFETYFGIRASTDIPPYFYIRDNRAVMPPTESIAANNTDGWTPIQGKFWRAGKIAPDLKLEEVLPRFTREAINVISDHAKEGGEKPLLLHLAYPAPHTPWLPSEEFVGTTKAGLYGDFVNMVDANIGQVLQALDDHKLADNTLVIFTSDNGPVWYDQDVERFGHDSSGGLRGMKADAWENGHRMPFIVRWPSVVKAGSVTNQNICFTDLLATFADISGVTLEKGEGPDSFSILTVLNGGQPEDKPIRGPIVMQAGRGLSTIRSGKWKYIDGIGSGGFSKPNHVKVAADDPVKGQLYNLEDDPGETRNLYLDFPEKVSELSEKMSEIKAADQTR